MRSILFISTFIFIVSCSATRSLQSPAYDDYDRALADSMLAYALDHEAIYSLLDTIKPISSVHFMRFAIAKDSTMKDGDKQVVLHDSLLHTIARYQKVCRTLSRGDWQFVLAPFKMTDKNYRNMEIYVVRKSRMASVLRQYSHFFGQWGFTPAADPAVILPVVEYESKNDRYRAYGYLFGYPEYAVDFFVESSKKTDADTTIRLVPRDFFAIPVYAGEKGYFTYAMPKGHQPGAEDSVIYRKSMTTLEKYRTVRDKYKTSTGLQAVRLWQDWNKEKR